MDDGLLNYLDTLQKGECYRIDAVLKDAPGEITERVFLIAADGSERGPFIRKRISLDSGMGDAYERIWNAQRQGERFVHLPRILEHSTDETSRIVVMEFVEGFTLEETAEMGGFTRAAASSIVALLCDAVQELHERFDPPLIHRDLKPSNIIVSATNLTVIDFGIARTFNEGASRDTKCFGTRGYAPPEQYGYGQTNERSDVYALGMLVAFCFLGEEPLPAVIDSRFDDPHIPETLQEILIKATAFNPMARHASAHALKEDLREAGLLDGVAGGPPWKYEERIPTPLPEIPGVPQSASSAVSYSPAASLEQSLSTSSPPSPASSSLASEPSEKLESPEMPKPSETPTPPETPKPLEAPEPSGFSQPSASSKRRRGALRVPNGIGIAWNVLVILVWLLFLMGAASAIVAPLETETITSPLARVIGYGGIGIFGFGFVAYALLDRRRLRARFAVLRHFPWYGESALLIVTGLVTIVVFAVLASALNSFIS